jgi:hypothetical protein
VALLARSPEHSVCGASSFLDACLVHFPLFEFIVNRRQHSVVGVLACRVVKHLNIIEHVLPCGFTGNIRPPPDTFALQELEEALRDSVVMTIPTSTHAGSRGPRRMFTN